MNPRHRISTQGLAVLRLLVADPESRGRLSVRQLRGALRGSRQANDPVLKASLSRTIRRLERDGLINGFTVRYCPASGRIFYADTLEGARATRLKMRTDATGWPYTFHRPHVLAVEITEKGLGVVWPDEPDEDR